MKWCSASWEYCGYAEYSWDLVREPTVKPVGKPDAGNPHVRLCVQRRLACSVGQKPTEVIVRSLVAWIAGRKETEFLKPIDDVILGMTVSHWAVTKVNAEVASKVSSPRGRAPNCRAKAAWIVAV
jgi:hypothetical protein